MGKNERQAYLRIWTLLYFQIFIDGILGIER